MKAARFPLLRCIFAALPLALSVSVPAAFEAEMAAFAAADAAHPPPSNAIPFVGSSSFTIWDNMPASFPNYPVLNRGFGGSQMSDVLDNFDRVVTRYHPPLVVVYEGDNDLAAGKTVVQVFSDFTNFVGRVHQQLPGTDIAFVSVKPSPIRAQILPQMRQLNGLIASLADGQHIRYVDIFTPMLDGSGQPKAELYQSDLLHMTSLGYSIWEPLINAMLDDWAGIQRPVALLTEPSSQNVPELQSVTFDSAASGTSPLFIQWLSNGVPIPGADQLSYTIPAVSMSMSGVVFSVSVSNLSSSITSSNALLSVGPPLPKSWLALLFDFGGTSATGHGAAPDDPTNYWNNVTTTTGGSSSAQMTNLVSTLNTPTTFGLAMLSRFNGANENGTTASPLFPADATRDSLFGNTETFSGLSDIFPRFKLTGLNPAGTYRLTFYASRTGVSDNRETSYTVTGANTNVAALNVANNITNVAIVSGCRPSDEGELTVSLAATANNNNANHFTYLGVLKLEAAPVLQLFSPLGRDGQVKVDWTGDAELQSARSVLGPWKTVNPTGINTHTETIVPGQNLFFRLQSR